MLPRRWLRALAFARHRRLAGRQVAVWRPHKAKATGTVVLFSHGFRGHNLQSAHLMLALADIGCLVLAPNHADRFTNLSQRQPFGGPTGWQPDSYRARADDLAEVLRAACQDRSLGPTFDPARLGLCGHSLGGYVCLALNGAVPAWDNFGLQARVLIGFSPYVRPLLDQGALTRVAAPTMLQTGTQDALSPAATRAFDQLSCRRVLVHFEGAAHTSWTGLERRPFPAMEKTTAAFAHHILHGQPLDPCLQAPTDSVRQIRWAD